jgi:hypothetical protein
VSFERKRYPKPPMKGRAICLVLSHVGQRKGDKGKETAEHVRKPLHHSPFTRKNRGMK